MYEEQCDSGPGEDCDQVCLTLQQPQCSPVSEERCLEVETTQCEQSPHQEVCGDIEVAECEPRTLRLREQQCNSTLVRLCGRPQSSIHCETRTEQECLDLPDLHCEVNRPSSSISSYFFSQEVAEEICQTRLEVTKHSQCFSVTDLLCDPAPVPCDLGNRRVCNTVTEKQCHTT